MITSAAAAAAALSVVESIEASRAGAQNVMPTCSRYSRGAW